MGVSLESAEYDEGSVMLPHDTQTVLFYPEHVQTFDRYGIPASEAPPEILRELVRKYLEEQRQGYGDKLSPAAMNAQEEIWQALGAAGFADN